MTARNTRFASITEAANYAGLTRRTIERWLRDGRLTRYKTETRRTRVDLAEVDRVLAPVPVTTCEANA